MLDPTKLKEFYVAVGAAVWHLQFLEDVLVTYLTMTVKLEHSVDAVVAHAVLDRERRKTLGALMTQAKAAGLLGDQVAEAFAVLEQRNWLIHKSMYEVSDSLYNDAQRQVVLERIRSLANQSLVLKKRLFADLSAWCQSQGVDIEAAAAAGLEEFQRLRDA